jgi:murein DD-endopeptidase MepM/ murein hydrolase activator NlpD
MYKRVLCILIICLAFVFAEDIEDKQRELQSIQEQLNNQQKLLQETRRRERATLRDLYVTNRKIKVVQENLSYSQRRLLQHTQELNKTQAELSKTTEEYHTHRAMFAKRIREIYKAQDLGILQLFFSRKSFSDLMNDSFYYRKIMEYDLATMQHMTILQYEMSRRQLSLRYQKELIEKTHKSIQQQKRIYEIQAGQQRVIYSNLRAKRHEYERTVAALLQNSREIETMIKQMLRNRQSIGHGTGRFDWPCRGPITSYYGMRRHPIFRITRMHTGLDIAAPMSADIKAADGGTVVFSGWWGGYGKAIIIDHGQGMFTVYGHMSRLYATKGTEVRKHTVIGSVGSTGYSTGPHCHFEIRRNGETVDPMKYLP